MLCKDFEVLAFASQFEVLSVTGELHEHRLDKVYTLGQDIKPLQIKNRLPTGLDPTTRHPVITTLEQLFPKNGIRI